MFTLFNISLDVGVVANTIIGLLAIVGFILHSKKKKLPTTVHQHEIFFAPDGSAIREKTTKRTFIYDEPITDSRKGINQGHAEAPDSKNISIKDDHINVKRLLYAAKKGEAKAQSTLGILYILGKGVKKNKDKAVQWFRKAARQGDAHAQFALGALYFSGEGVVSNGQQAGIWMIVAKASGYTEAEKILNSKEWNSLLTPAEMTSARQKAEKLFNKTESRRIKE